MNETLQIVSVLVAAIWWGGLITTDLILAPLRMGTPQVDRAILAAVGRHIDRNFGFIELGFTVVLLFLVILAGASLSIAVTALFAVLLTILGIGVIVPRMGVLGNREIVTEEQAQRLEREQQTLRRSYLALDIFKMILGGALISALVVG